MVTSNQRSYPPRSLGHAGFSILFLRFSDLLTLVLLVTLSPCSRGATLHDAFPKLPLIFEANQGQHPAGVRFMSRGYGYSLFLDDRQATLVLANASVGIRLVGAAVQQDPRGIRPAASKLNYFVGQDKSRWHIGVPTFEAVEYSQVYPGIDLRYYGNQRHLEYDLVVGPGADPSQIRIAFDGAGPVRMRPGGDMTVKAGPKEVRFCKPTVYQEKDGMRIPVAGSYLVHHGREVSRPECIGLFRKKRT